MKKQNVEESAADELARLREENKRLSEALKMAEWMNHAKDVMIDEAEKTFNIPIRKKSGASRTASRAQRPNAPIPPANKYNTRSAAALLVLYS